MQKAKNIGWLYYAFLLIPILDLYSFGIADFAYFSLIIVCFWGLFIKINNKRNYIPFLVLSVLVIAHELYFLLFHPNFSISSWVNKIIGMCLFIYATIVFSESLELKKLYKIWKFVGLIFMFGMLYHSLQYYVFQTEVSVIKIPGFPVTTSNAYESVFGKITARPCSFFTEPSHYASFMLPLLFLNYYFKDIKYAYINTIFIILSTSSIGIIFAAYFWVAFSMMNSSTVQKLLGIIFAAVVIYAFLTLDFFEFSREKILSSNGEDASSSLRLYFSMNVWYNLSLPLKFTGIPAANIGDYLTVHPELIPDGLLWVLDDESSINYSSSVWYVAIKYGLILFGVYIFMYIRFIKDSLHSPIFFYALFLFICIFIQACFLNQIFLTQFVLMFILLKEHNKIYESNYCNNILR